MAGYVIAALFAVTGLAMIIFARPFERFSQRPEWNRAGPHGARFYRTMGILWLVIAAVIAIFFPIPELHRAT